MRKTVFFIFILFLGIVMIDSNEDDQFISDTNFTNLENSSAFEVNNKTMYGEEGKFGLVKENGNDSEPDYVAGKEGRFYGVYFWGEQEEDLVGKKYRMDATPYESDKETKKLYEWEITENNDPSIEATGQSGAKFAFDEGETGLWKIDVTVDDEQYTSFIIEVEE